jgi:prepilin-type N-terminal cleavage/methylation domain-containing protein
MNKKSFTLLELIIVIIIIGVITSLALPRLFKTIESSRSSEALIAFATIRSAMERCYLLQNGSYYGCHADGSALAPWEGIGISSPSLSPNSHFRYRVGVSCLDGNCDTFEILARRNTLDGGDGSSVVVMYFSNSRECFGKKIDICGQGSFSHLGECNCQLGTDY